MELSAPHLLFYNNLHMATIQELTEINMLNECAMECTRQSRWKETTQRYLSNMLVNNMELREELLNHKYKVSPTTDFPLNERGHIRAIEAPVVRDRIVQKTLMKNILTPSIRPCLIYDNYASLTSRGTAFARKRFEIMLRRYINHNGTDGYVLLIDVKKYFENINHGVLKWMLSPKISNQPQDVIDLIHYIIDTSSKTEKGLNLGSEAPQIFAVYYLHPVDHYIKVVNGIKYYGRYMDDIFIIGKTKKELNELLSEIEQILAGLLLEVNDKKTHIVRLKHGFTFLQVKYNVSQSGKILKRMSHGKITRERRRLKAFRRMINKGQMTESDVQNCYLSWRGTTIKDHNACRNSIDKMDRIFKTMFSTNTNRPIKSRRKLAIKINHEAETRDLKLCSLLAI